jgi:hypothetical protein
VPLEFPISFIGAKPTVQVDLSSPPALAPPTLMQSLSTKRMSTDGSSAARSRPTGAARGGAGGARDALLQSAEHVITFDRLLVGKRDCRTFTVSNTGLLPFKWRLAGEALPAEFKVRDPGSGDDRRPLGAASALLIWAPCFIDMCPMPQAHPLPPRVTPRHLVPGMASRWGAPCSQQRCGPC